MYNKTTYYQLESSIYNQKTMIVLTWLVHLIELLYASLNLLGPQINLKLILYENRIISLYLFLLLL